MFKKSVRSALALALVVVLVVCAFGGCSNTTTQGSSSGSESTSNSSQQQSSTGGNVAEGDTWQIAVIAPLTGSYSQHGEAYKNATTLLSEKVNAEGGIAGRKLEIVYYDDKNEAKEAVSVAQKILSDSEHVTALLGPWSSTCAIAVAPLFQDAKIPMIGPSSSHVDLTPIGDYIIRGGAIQQVQQKLFVEFLGRNYPDLKTVSILHQNDEVGNSVNECFAQYWKEAGNEVIDQETFLTGQGDFAAQISKIQQGNPDAFFIYGSYSDCGIIVKQCDDLDFKPQLLFGPPTFQKEFIELADGRADGCLIWMSLDLEAPNEEFQAFKKEYNERFAPTELNSHSYCAYDALYLLCQAIEASNGDRTEMAKFMRNNDGVEGVMGTYKIVDGNPEKPMFAVSIENGEFVSVPDSAAK